MKSFLIIFFAVKLLIIASTASQFSEDFDISRQPRDINFFEDKRRLVKDLADKLNKSAQNAVEFVSNFSAGIQDKVTLFTNKIEGDIHKFQGNIEEAVNKANGQLNTAGELVTSCIESHRQEAENLIDNTYAISKACADDRVKDLEAMMFSLNVMSNEALDFANGVVKMMANCTLDGAENVFAVGSCLSSVAFQTQIRAMVFMANSGVLIARINFMIATLPGAFEICAGKNMFEASMGTAKIVMEIGGCTASSLFTYFTF